MDRRQKSYTIAIAGISTALAMIFVVIAIYVDTLSLSMNVIAGICVMIPMTKKSYKGSILAFVSTSILAGVLNIFSALPFIIFFGSYTIFSQIMVNKKVKWYFQYPLKLAWFNIILYVFYNLVGLVFINFDKLGFSLNYAWIAVIGSALFVLYDLLMIQVFKVLNYYINRYIK